MGLWQKWNDAHKNAVAEAPYTGHFKGVYVVNGEITYTLAGKTRRQPAAGITADFEAAERKSTTATRVIAGGVLFGPIGAVAGGLLKKDKGKVYAIVTIPDAGTIILDAPIKDEAKAREFVAKVNAAGAHYAQ